MIAIGTSLGGLNALSMILKTLPASFSQTVVIVQHRLKGPDVGLSQLLQRCSALPLIEPEDKDPLLGGRVYIAPADYHLLVEAGAVALSTEERVNYARPSIDVLFETAAECYGPAVVGVVLTGANDDGARGARRILDLGGRVLIQDPATAESGIMPSAALATTGLSRVHTLEEIAAELVQLGNR